MSLKQDQENRIKVVNLIREILGFSKKESKGLESMREKDAMGKVDAGSQLEIWQNIAKERLNSRVMRFFKGGERDPLNSQLYSALKELNVEKPSEESIKKLNDIFLEVVNNLQEYGTGRPAP